MELFYGWLISLAGAFVLGMGVATFVNPDKRKCELNLPRDVECVWAPPANYVKE